MMDHKLLIYHISNFIHVTRSFKWFFCKKYVFNGYFFFIFTNLLYSFKKRYLSKPYFFRKRSIIFISSPVSIIKTGLSLFIICAKPLTTDDSWPFTSIFIKSILASVFLIFFRYILLWTIVIFFLNLKSKFILFFNDCFLY